MHCKPTATDQNEYFFSANTYRPLVSVYLHLDGVFISADLTWMVALIYFIMLESKSHKAQSQ